LNPMGLRLDQYEHQHGSTPGPFGPCPGSRPQPQLEPYGAAPRPVWTAGAIEDTDSGTRLAALDHALSLPPPADSWEALVRIFHLFRITSSLLLLL